jgi:hypothetical protein
MPGPEPVCEHEHWLLSKRWLAVWHRADFDLDPNADADANATATAAAQQLPGSGPVCSDWRRHLLQRRLVPAGSHHAGSDANTNADTEPWHRLLWSRPVCGQRRRHLHQRRLGA